MANPNINDGVEEFLETADRMRTTVRTLLARLSQTRLSESRRQRFASPRPRINQAILIQNHWSVIMISVRRIRWALERINRISTEKNTHETCLMFSDIVAEALIIDPLARAIRNSVWDLTSCAPTSVTRASGFWRFVQVMTQRIESQTDKLYELSLTIDV